MDIDTDIRYVKGVGEKLSVRFNRLGVRDVDALIRFFPRSYEDMANITRICDIQEGGIFCVKGTLIDDPENRRTRGGLVAKTSVSDGTGLMSVVFFNNRYITSMLKAGKRYLFYGKVSLDAYSGMMSMSSPHFADENDVGLVPVYRLTEGLTSKKIKTVVKNALESVKDSLEETLPEYIIKKYDFPGIYDAFNKIHFPKDKDEFECARRRFVFEELLSLRLGLLLLKTRVKKHEATPIKLDVTKQFESLLPFSLTNAQKRCIEEAVCDMKRDIPMNRLLQGDVGSGKTAVAASIIYCAAKNGFQSALMAPTEILAAQHADTMSKLFGDKIKTALLTGSATRRQREKIKAELLSGSLDLLIGTHALITPDIEFKSLGLVVTDEQHRFGVAQRTELSKKGAATHTLVMSATPIPRTLALIIYGDLDISVLDELPSGRQKVKTYAVTSDYHERIYRYIKKFIDRGLQCYVVCPLVEESEESDLVSAEEYFNYLKNEVFPGYNLGLLHGRMNKRDKDCVMRSFADNEINILVSTVVIEVGINVPNACVMVIENAERFGLSQLHQLRGRIGRGKDESVCILVSDAKNERSLKRLESLCSTTDGFKIAEEDLKLRGPGDFLGSRQHGLPELKIADIASDSTTLYEAGRCADEILSDDPLLKKSENACLNKTVKKMFSNLGPTGTN